MVKQVSIVVETLADATVFRHGDLRFDALSVSCVVPRNDVLRGSGPVETSIPVVPIGVFRDDKGRPFDNGGVYLSPQRRSLSFDGFPEVRRDRDIRRLGLWLYASLFEPGDELYFATEVCIERNVKHLWKRRYLLAPEFLPVRKKIATRRLELEKHFMRRRGIRPGDITSQEALDLYKRTFEKVHGVFAEQYVPDTELPSLLRFEEQSKWVRASAA